MSATELPVVVAVDGGNSKTDVAVVRIDGEVLSVLRSSGHRPHVIGTEAAEDELRTALEQALENAGRPEVVGIGAYVANADFAIEEQALLASIVSWGFAPTVRVGNDTLALLRSGVTEPVGVAVVCGAGINCVGLGRNGEVARFPAIGALTGDWGGGNELALGAMYYAARAEDGRGLFTSLSPLIADHFGRSSALAVAEAIHLGAIERERLYEVVPVLFAAAEQGDRLARELIGRQAEEVVTMANTVLDKVGLRDSDATVVLGGGVLAADNPLLSDAVRAGIAAVHPHARIVVPELSPLAGAILLAIDQLDVAAESRARIDERVRRTLPLAATVSARRAPELISQPL